jgi:hypothetical protein
VDVFVRKLFKDVMEIMEDVVVVDVTARVFVEIVEAAVYNVLIVDRKDVLAISVDVPIVIANTVDVPNPGTTILAPISEEKNPVCNVIRLATRDDSPIDDTYILLLGTNWPPVDVTNMRLVDTGTSNTDSKKVLFALSSL